MILSQDRAREFDISIKRLLSSLDRREYSSTRGCFDRNYWHFKTNGFASAARQQGLQSLCLIYNLPDSKYYKSSYILDCIRYSIEFTHKIQHRDGSFDEWYVNERGWSGPGGYILHSLCRTYFLVGDKLDSSSKNLLLKTIRLSLVHLRKSKEKQVIANHIAIVMCGVYESFVILKEQWILEFYKDLKNEFFSYVSAEGWALEYDGMDLAYTSASISFLSYIDEIANDDEISSFCIKSLEFLSHFMDHNGKLFGSLGSRNTVTHFYRGYSYWGKSNELSKYICSLVLNSHDDPSHVEHDDHYFIYRFNEYLETLYNLETWPVLETTQKRLPIDGASFERTYDDAGIYILNTIEHYIVINMKKFGSIVRYDKIKKTCHVDSSVVVKIKNQLFTSEISNKSSSFIRNGRNMISSGSLTRFNQRNFSASKKAAFDLFMLVFGSHRISAYLIKSLIKKLLIIGNKESKIEFKKSITINDDSILVNIELSGLTCGSEVFYNGVSTLRYVPQSRYYQFNCIEDKLEKKIANGHSFTQEYRL